MIQKRGFNEREELNKWKFGQNFDLPSWITLTMRFMTISNLSEGVPIAEYIENTPYYRSYTIQADRFSGSDVMITFGDDEDNVVLLSASCTVLGNQLIQVRLKSRHSSLGELLPSNKEVSSEEKKKVYEQDLNYDDLDYDLDHTNNTKNYQISKVSERAKNHERIKSSTENQIIFIFQLSFQEKINGDLVVIVMIVTWNMFLDQSLRS
ncbi:hypothetical protein RclHR1_14710001 [Rhizophagus clarus]|uniref:Uncharacterized protein n=1 Tax=Rhizophagus clarus TaxID=94130 RepID=A0A2Z6QSR2_9GLOM|nr:hypothetical protein RclHR1_14710001 [Rhizophagus clarus]